MSETESNDTDRTADEREAVRKHLTNVAELATATGNTRVAAELTEERIPALESGTLTMVVLGEFNHGKSTVINALLDSDTLPTGITPTTSVITHLVHGEGDATLVFSDEERQVPRDKLGEHLTEDAMPGLRHVRVPSSAPILEGGLVIVDTPGVNDISKQKVEITYGYVPRADVVVYVLDASQALKRSEIAFIRERLIRNRLDRIFFVLGKVDALDEDELKKVRDHVESTLRDIVGPTITYPLSARRAIAGSDRGFDAFKAAVEHQIGSDRDQILADGALRAGLRLGTLVEQGIAIELGALDLEVDELDERIERVRERLNQSATMVTDSVERIQTRGAEIRAAARANLQQFSTDFRESLGNEVQRASTDDVKKYLPDFIHSRFQEWIQHEGTHVGLQLEELAEEIIEITNRNMREAVDAVNNELVSSPASLDFDVDTFGYDVGVFAVGALGVGLMAFSNLLVGGALAVAAPVLAFALKGRVDGMIREQAIEQGTNAIEKATHLVDAELDRMIGEFNAQLQQFVEDAGHQLYLQVGDVLNRIRDQRSQMSEEELDLKPQLLAQREALRAELVEMRKLRDALKDRNEEPQLLH